MLFIRYTKVCEKIKEKGCETIQRNWWSALMKVKGEKDSWNGWYFERVRESVLNHQAINIILDEWLNYCGSTANLLSSFDK